jgi:hypothetical protein
MRIQSKYQKDKNVYGECSDGTPVTPPKGWKILPENLEVPQVHREFAEDYSSGFCNWCSPRRCRSTMTPIWAMISGYCRAFAVPEDFDISTLRDYTPEAERNKSYFGKF